MTIIRYIPTGKNQWDIKVDGRKVGRITKQRRKGFQANLPRYVDFPELGGISAFVQRLNERAA